MSLNSILNIASSGMNVAQAQLRVVSDNVSNVNTPGYIRKIADQEAAVSQGQGAGVDVARIRLATDRFLQVASLNAASDSSSQMVQYELYENIQALFGDPSEGGYFAKIDDLFASMMQTAENATSGPMRADSVYKLQSMLEEANRVSGGIQDVRANADSQLLSAVSRSNELLQQIESLNNEIAKASVVGADATGAQTAQNSLLTELAGLMDIRITNRSQGGIEVRTGTGILLAGKGAATISYTPAGAVTAGTSFEDIKVTEPTGQVKSLTQNLMSGEIKGLLAIRDVEGPRAAERLAELTARLVDGLNAAHNSSTSIPAPATLTGRDTGMSLANALQGFSGVTTIATVSAQGVVQNRADIVFDGTGGTINGLGFTAANFTAQLSAALGGANVSFDNGVLKIEASGGQGVAIGNDPTNPSQKAGRGFSHFFGLNDLIQSRAPNFYDTGLTAGSDHGFAAGQTMRFRFTDSEGNRIKDLEFTLPANTTMQGLMDALNNVSTGIGRYGSFSLSPTGELKFSGRGNPVAQLSVLTDDTRSAHSDMNLSSLFGLGGARANRATTYSVRSDIKMDSNQLGLAQLDLSAAAGAVGISLNDGRGGQKLANVYQSVSKFSAAGRTGEVEMSMSRYASELSGELGSRAKSFKSNASSAELIYAEAVARRTSIEGVNLDEELLNMTTFQQAYNASARLIQAVTEMYDTLIGMVR